MTAMRIKRYPSSSGGFALGKMGVGATLLKQGKTVSDYVQDGLVFLAENLEPPQSGVQSVDVGVNLSPDTFTIEWCGIHDGTQRSGIFVNPSGDVATRSFGFGWWVDTNNTNINSRVYYQETRSGQYVGTKTQFSLVVSGGTRAVFYEAGTPFADVSGSLVSSAIAQMRQGSETWRYINCGPLDYVSYDSLRVYSRALTASEIAANYAIDRERFNLP